MKIFNLNYFCYLFDFFHISLLQKKLTTLAYNRCKQFLSLIWFK